MRQTDEGKHPAAAARERSDNVKLVSGLVIAAAGLAVVFIWQEFYLGFGAAMIGTGLVPFEKIASTLKR